MRQTTRRDGRQSAPIGFRLAQRAVQNSGHVVVSRGRKFDALTRLGPQRLGHQDMQMRRQLKATPKPLRKADASPESEACPMPGTLGHLALPTPDGLE